MAVNGSIPSHSHKRTHKLHHHSWRTMLGLRTRILGLNATTRLNMLCSGKRNSNRARQNRMNNNNRMVFSSSLFLELHFVRKFYWFAFAPLHSATRGSTAELWMKVDFERVEWEKKEWKKQNEKSQSTDTSGLLSIRCTAAAIHGRNVRRQWNALRSEGTEIYEWMNSDAISVRFQ